MVSSPLPGEGAAGDVTVLKFESTSALKFIASLTRDQGLAEVLALLAHAVRTVRLAPHDAALREHLVDDLLQRFQRKLEGEATVQVHPFELYKDGLMVYEDHNRAESLAVRLFRAGVASLTLTPQVDRESLDTLLEVLAIPQPPNSGRDLALLAWRSRFTGIGLEERPGYALEMLNPSQEAPSTAFYQGIRSALRFFTPQDEGELLAPTPSATPDTLSALHERLTLAPPPRLEPLDLQRAHRGLVDLALEALASAPSGQEETIQRLTEALALSGAREALDGLYAQLQADPSPRAAQLVARGASARTLMGVLRGMSEATEATWVARFFATWTRSTPKELCALFEHNIADRAVRLLTLTLWEHPQTRQEHWNQLLDAANAGTALEILRALAALPPTEARFQIQLRACIHRDPAVRGQAIHDIPPTDDPRFQSILLMGLKDVDAGVRMEVLRRLHERRDPAVGILLVDRVRRPDFWLMSNAERRLLLALLVDLGGTHYSAFLLERLDQAETQLSRVEALGHNTAQERQVAEALLDAIALIPNAQLLDELQRRLVLGAPASLEEAYQRTRAALKNTITTPPPPPPPRTAPSRRTHRTLHDLPTSQQPHDGPTRIDTPAITDAELERVAEASAREEPAPPPAPRAAASPEEDESPFIEDLLESYLREDSLTAPSGGSGLWSTLAATPALMKELMEQDVRSEETS